MFCPQKVDTPLDSINWRLSLTASGFLVACLLIPVSKRANHCRLRLNACCVSLRLEGVCEQVGADLAIIGLEIDNGRLNIYTRQRDEIGER